MINLKRLLPMIALLCGAAAPSRFALPMQPWTSSDGRVSLLRPAIAHPTESTDSLDVLTPPGWRLLWTGERPTHGQMVVRLTIKVMPQPPATSGTEALQIGTSAEPSAVRSCLTYGLHGASGQRLPDRSINGVRYTAWRNGDSGMSQAINAIDLRTVVRGVCYAVDRFSVAESAGNNDLSVKVPGTRGAEQMDAALASLRIGRGEATAPTVHLPPGTVAR